MSCARSRNSRRSPSSRRNNKCTHHSSSPRGRNKWRFKSPPENCRSHIFSEAQAARALLLAPSASAVTNTASRTAMPLLSGTAHALLQQTRWARTTNTRHQRSAMHRLATTQRVLVQVPWWGCRLVTLSTFFLKPSIHIYMSYVYFYL